MKEQIFKKLLIIAIITTLGAPNVLGKDPLPLSYVQCGSSMCKKFSPAAKTKDVITPGKAAKEALAFVTKNNKKYRFMLDFTAAKFGDFDETAIQKIVAAAGENLNALYLNGHPTLSKLDLSQCAELVELEAIGCKDLKELKGISDCNALERFSARDSGLQVYVMGPGQDKLVLLDVGNCTKLKNLYLLGYIGSVQEIYAENTPIEGSLDLGGGRQLKKLNVSQCRYLTSLGNSTQCRSLEEVNVTGTAIKEIQFNAPNLATLKIEDCKQIAAIELKPQVGVKENGSAITELDLTSCADSLKKLSLYANPKLAELKGFARCKKLEWIRLSELGISELDLRECNKNITSTSSITVDRCPNLKKVDGVLPVFENNVIFAK